MSNVATVPQNDQLIHDIIVGGDISKLSPKQKTEYYLRTCQSLGLNPVTKPFDYISLNGKIVLYAKKDATEQLRKINGVSIDEMDGKTVSDVFIVTVKVRDKEGRTDIATGAVTIKGLTGDALANATMKAETKAKRRATLSICGLGILDETELETIPNTAKTNIHLVTDETHPPAPAAPAEQTAPAAEPRKTKDGAPVILTEGEAIPSAYWNLNTDVKRSVMPEGCCAKKINGVWLCVPAE